MTSNDMTASIADAENKDWWIFRGTQAPHDGITRLPPAPPWRPSRGNTPTERASTPAASATTHDALDRGTTFIATAAMKEMVNAALYLRRPLLITGRPGTGKSSLIYAVARELKLGAVLRWPITSRSTLQQGLYSYDAIGRLQEVKAGDETPKIESYMELGPLGTALLPTTRPRALLIDEIDKSDIDLPNDLLNVFEEGQFAIPELARHNVKQVPVRGHRSDETYEITKGHVECDEFPFVVLTSNGEREFPPPFLRRCLRLEMPEPQTVEDLGKIVAAHLKNVNLDEARPIIEQFLERRRKGRLVATDQLLNAISLVIDNHRVGATERSALADTVMQELATEASSSTGA